jgi:tetratricopeptide (TPR) repeat protein
VIAIYNNSPSESLAETLYQFATGRWGSYQTRMNALRAVSEHHPDLIPDDHTIKMYVGGEQSDVMFLNHHIYWGPKDTEELDDAIIELHTEAYQLIQAGDYDEAEPLLHEIIAAAPDFPSAYNHLAMVYQMQDRQDEAFALIDLVNEKFPDYFFGRIAKANQHTLANETVQASAILKSLFQIEELHISEYRALAQAQVQLAIKEDRRDVARSWLSMWEQVDEGNPQISSLKIRVEGSKGIMQRLRNLLG